MPPANHHIYLTCESGRIIEFNTESKKHKTIFRHPSNETMMALAFHKDDLFFGGKTFIGKGHFINGNFNVTKLKSYRTPYSNRAYAFLTKLGFKEKALKYVDQAFHQMNIYGRHIYITATNCNEIWIIDLDLQLKNRININPHYKDYNHINNIFHDGKAFYVCLMRSSTKFGYSGYAMYDKVWNELERRSLGWESHAFCIVDNDKYNLCASAGFHHSVYHPHRSGLMKNGELVFEHDPDKYYCKDFSMDDNNIFIVGGEVKQRIGRKLADGVVFRLDRKFNLLDQHIIPEIGGICGCRLREEDYTVGTDL